MKPYTIQEYEKLPWDHLMCNLTPLVMGCDLMSCWCNDHKIIVKPDRSDPHHTRYIPHDDANFSHGYVKRPKIKLKKEE